MTLIELINTTEAKLALGGFAGSVIATVMGYKGRAAALRVLTVGTLSAIYLGPFVPLLLDRIGINIPEKNAIGFGGFVVGVFNISIIELLKVYFSSILEKFKVGSP